MPIREGVGTETLDGSDSVEGNSLDSLRIRHHYTSVQQSQHRFEQGATLNFPNRSPTDSADRELSCKTWPAMGAQTQTHLLTNSVISRYATMTLSDTPTGTLSERGGDSETPVLVLECQPEPERGSAGWHIPNRSCL